jgi:RimJ/RimL family protein N-acetyltransferase
VTGLLTAEGSSPGPDDAFPRGRRVALRAVRNTDIVPLQRLAATPAVRDTWRTRGAYWSPAELQQRISADPHLALVVTDAADGDVLGLAELHDLDLVDARAQLALMTDPRTWASPVAAEAAVLFVGHAFRTLPLQKVAVTVQAGNERAVPGLRRLLHHEGTLRRHLNVNGRWADLDLYAVWRSDLPALERRLGLGPTAGATDPTGPR